MKKRIIAGAAAVVGAALAAAALAGCSGTDVVAKAAKSSFEAVERASAGRVAWSGPARAWELASPGGDRVYFASDFSGSGPDARFSFDAEPFAAAGLDAAKLPQTEGVAYKVEDGRLEYLFELGGDEFSPGAERSLSATFAEIVRTQRARLGYHEKLDHFGIKLGGGNMLEWAKDSSRNDKDIVFVLDPAPIIAAGADPAGIRGWAFAKVEIRDEKGAIVQVDKLLKPYDLP